MEGLFGRGEHIGMCVERIVPKLTQCGATQGSIKMFGGVRHDDCMYSNKKIIHCVQRRRGKMIGRERIWAYACLVDMFQETTLFKKHSVPVHDFCCKIPGLRGDVN